MTVQKTLIVLMAVLGASHAAAQTPVTYLWGVDAANQVSRRGSAGWENVAGPAIKQVSFGVDGTVWALTTSGSNNIVHWSGAGWIATPGTLKQISVASLQQIWGVSATDEVYRWTGTGWTRMPGALTQISVAADGTVWGVTALGSIYRWTGSRWELVAGQAKYVSVGSADNVWVIGSDDIVYQRSGATWQRTGGLSLAKISASAQGELWGVTAGNQIYKRTGSTWQQMDGQLMDISVGPTILEAHSVIGAQLWLNAAPSVRYSTTSPVTGCPAGWAAPTKDDLNLLLQYAVSSGDASAFLASPTGFKAAPGDAIVSSTKVYPEDTDGSHFNAAVFWALKVNPASLTQISTYFPAPLNMVSRCIRAGMNALAAVNLDMSACSTGFGSTTNATSIDVSRIQVTDLARQAKEPTMPFFGENPLLAPITADPQGGGYLLWTSPSNRAIMTRIGTDSRPADTSSDEDLGPAVRTAALGLNGQTIGYLLRSAQHKLEFRVKGGATTVIMDNDVVGNQPVLYSGRGLLFKDSQGRSIYGTEAMYYPVELHNGSVLSVGGKWYASFDHYNNFNAYSNPGVANAHTAASILSFNDDGSGPLLRLAWGVSHSIDSRAISDGERLIDTHLGDSYPQSIVLYVTDPETGRVKDGINLFERGAFPDTVISTQSDGSPIYGIAGNGGGQSSGKLGDLMQVGCGQYVLSYAVRPATFGSFTSKLDELGLLFFDKDGNIIARKKLRQGSDVETLKSARYGTSAILVAWKTKDSNDYWVMLVDSHGLVLQDPQKLPAGVVFSNRDDFTMMKNGDILWTTAQGSSNLKLFRIPAPPTQEASGLSGNYTLKSQSAPGMCLDVDAGGGSGAKVQIWSCNGAANQSFTFVSEGNSVYQIHPSYNPGLCLDVVGGGNSPRGTKVDVWNCNGGSNQKWSVISDGDNIYEMSPLNASELRLDILGNGTSSGTQIGVWSPTGGSNQKWAFTK